MGGIPFKKITEVSGMWSVGKTTLALTVVASAQRQGIECIWVDAEYAWDNEYAKMLGVDVKKLGLLQRRVAEDSLDELLEYVEKGKDTLIIIDAVGALHPRDEAEKDSGSRTIGAQSGLMARFCRKIVPMLAVNNNALLVLNHEYEDVMKAMPGRPNPIKTSGGRKLEYHKSIWIRLSKTGTNIKKGEEFTGFVVQAEIRKNKLAPTLKQKCEMELRYTEGFRAEANPLADLIAKGTIRKEGGNYFLGETKIAFGQEKAKKWIEEHADELK